MPTVEGITVTGVDTVKAALQEIYANISGPVLRDALYAAANVFKSAIEAATPIGRSEYVYQKNGRTIKVKSKRSPGQAQANVIVYERKSRGLSVSAEQLGLLVGYEKKHAYYMYWREYGTAKMPAQPFFRSAADGAYDDAFNAAENIVKAGIEGAK